MKLKIIIFTILFVFLFYFSVFLAGVLPFIAKYKAKFDEFKVEVLWDYTGDIILHPIENIKLMHAAANPLLYLSTSAALFLFIYLLFKSRQKNYENVGEKYGVQGSSRWAKNSEILKVPEQITVIPSNKIYSALKKTLGEYEVK